MILTMGKRKKKTVAPKPEIPKKVIPVQKKTVVDIEEDDDALPSFGIMPSRDLKKNLGCG
jgi:hypothetical protein